jgi:hypothetical protein
MKTKLCFFVCSAFLLLVVSNNANSQSLYESPTDLTTFNSSFDLNQSYTFTNDQESFNFTEALNSVDETLGLEEEVHDPQDLIRFASTMLAVGAGLAFGDSQTLYCLHAAYYLRLAMYTRSALYGSLGAAFDGLSNDSFTRSLIDLQFRLLMFHAITQYRQVHLIYGLMLAYAFGTEKFDGGSKYDITRFTAALVMGFNIILSAQFSIMLQTNILAHQRWTQKLNSSEIENNTTWGFINKNNLLTLSLVWTLANSRSQ